MHRLLQLLLVLISTTLPAQRLVVHESNRYLATADGQPFFYLADTAWELLHRCNREEVDLYLNTRAKQGFNVVQTVALAELEGLTTPNPYGELPLIDRDPAQPNEAYFEHVDYVIDRAAELGLHIALLPTWGDKLYKNSWGVGPEVLNPTNAKAFGTWIGRRYADRDNLMWIVGGDRNPRQGSQDVAVWNAMAAGVLAGAGEGGEPLMSYHPQPKEDGGSSTWFHAEDWLDFNMHQTGHCGATQATYTHIEHDYALSPTKPVLDGEPLYEDHPNCFNARELGYSVADDIRRIMYQNVFAGACGQTYGCHDVWQMFTLEREGINGPLRPWPVALDLPMASRAHHLKDLMLSRPYFSRVPDQNMIVNSADEINRVGATRDETGRYAMIYLPTGGTVSVDLSNLAAESLTSWWFDPRTGSSSAGPALERAEGVELTAPSTGSGHDWVLVIDAEAFSRPGAQ